MFLYIFNQSSVLLTYENDTIYLVVYKYILNYINILYYIFSGPFIQISKQNQHNVLYSFIKFYFIS